MKHNLSLSFLVAACLITGTLSAQHRYVTIIDNDTTFFDQGPLILKTGNYRGDSIRWRISENNHGFRNFTGETADSLVIGINSSAYYRYSVFEGSCKPVDSNVATVYYIPDTCAFHVEDYLGSVSAYERWNDNAGDFEFQVNIVKNEELSTENVIVLDITGLFTGDETSFYRIFIDLKNYLMAPDPENPPVVNEDIYNWGYGRLWFDYFSDFQLGTCEDYIKFNVTPALNDTGLWWGSTVTYYLGPGALNLDFGKKATGPAISGTIHRSSDLIKQ